MKRSETDIIRSEPLGDDTWLLELSAGDIAEQVVPGQFLQVRAGAFTDPFLRRTVSVSGADRARGRMQLMIRMVGPGTNLICSRPCGPGLDIIGPLGNGFDLSAANGPAWLVAGGIGAAPLVFLANELARKGHSEVVYFMGAKNHRGLFGIERFLGGDIPVEVATEDGSAGYHGFVTGLIERRLALETPAVIYTCGPRLMMQAVVNIARNANIPCQVSLEERMACGVGACYGCAVELAGGRMARVCHDGPVFDSGAIAWK